MVTATGEYALRALSFLAQQAGNGPAPSRRIADEAGVPRKYLSAILADLVRTGLLDAFPGKSGGFRLARPPHEIALYEVLGPFEPALRKRRPCPFGQSTCTDEDPCGGHEHWKKVRDAYSEFLHQTSLYDISTKGPAQTQSGSAKEH